MKIFMIFVILNVLNVIIQTVKSICTIKCGKKIAALVNATAYGLYTVVIVYTMCDLSLWVKALVVAVANLIGVYIVKDIEERKRKDKIWKIDVTITKEDVLNLTKDLDNNNLSYSLIAIENKNKYLIPIYSYSKEESEKVKSILISYNVKYFVSETKYL